jgi:hypothetical protein
MGGKKKLGLKQMERQQVKEDEEKAAKIAAELLDAGADGDKIIVRADVLQLVLEEVS